jgi:hypothetical protein
MAAKKSEDLLMQYRLVFAGGCHVGGYLVGAQSSFVTIALNVLAHSGLECEARTLEHLPLTHPERLKQFCTSYRPDVLVLQVGNWETNKGLRDYLRTTVGLKKTSSHSKTSYSVTRTPGEHAPTSFHPGLMWRTKSVARQVVDVMLLHTIVDVQKVHRLLSVFFSEVATLRISAVIALSPLPCADPVHMYYRRRVLPAFEAEATKHGFHYLNAFFLQTHERRATCIFADAGHLNAEGHRMLGELVGRHIASLLAAPNGFVPIASSSDGPCLEN